MPAAVGAVTSGTAVTASAAVMSSATAGADFMRSGELPNKDILPQREVRPVVRKICPRGYRSFLLIACRMGIHYHKRYDQR